MWAQERKSKRKRENEQHVGTGEKAKTAARPPQRANREEGNREKGKTGRKKIALLQHVNWKKGKQKPHASHARRRWFVIKLERE
jgi:hypothetical protein